MSPPPSATAPYEEYTPEAIQAMMDAVTQDQASAWKRAVGALAMIALGALILMAQGSYSPFDGTADTAGVGGVSNWLGAPGAWLANILMQTMGLAGLLAGGLAVWSGLRRILRGKARVQTRSDRAGRALIFVGAVLMGAATLSAFPIPQSWPMGAGLGGWFGDLMHLGMKSWLDRTGLPFSGGIVALVTFLGFGVCLARHLGVVRRDVVDIIDAAGLVWAYLRVGLDKAAAWLDRIFRRNYEVEIAGAAPVVRTIPDAPQAIEESIGEAPPAAPPVKPKPKSKPKSKPMARKMVSPKRGQPAFDFSDATGFVLPTPELLNAPPPRSTVRDETMLQRQSDQLHRVMGDYGVEGEMGDVSPGPVVTMFEFEPAPGVKSSRVINLASDIARNMSAQSARIAVVPGRNALGVEMPNRKRETVWLRDMLDSDAFQKSDARLPLVMGEDIGGQPFVTDLASMPHMLVAGTTGSGKSVAVNAMILSLMSKLTPDECKFIMIDPKMLELSVYDGAPHLLAPVVTEPKKAVVALKWAVREMEDRYRKMSQVNVRGMEAFNQKVAESKASGETLSKTVQTGFDHETGEPVFETQEFEFEPMPYIVVIIDEMADLMMVAKKDIEGSIQRLAQMARAAGIHLIVATQRPSTDVITGTIKSNFPTKVCFRVGSKIDSRVILGEMGGEQLLGKGDMLFLSTSGPKRYHGPFVSDAEVERVANFVRAQGTPAYLDDITNEPDEEAPSDPTQAGGGSEGGSLFDQAVAIVANDRKASTSYIQRRLSIGYNRAADLIDRMEQEGMIGEAGSGGKREIFLPESEAF
ncbi:DNA translocase FtsK 4TM domain-containing protein [uncultured Algimonas sp.]|uniref:FtsK/SpoIIIE family DNA translocase n=1 Tax=uncultured Algimonas sp. TaxID=1547920 RepID=UPI002603F53E|nr:DNA translocase FtsK 4TM domain-containing protein [uncultured Algimonas sp.]